MRSISVLEVFLIVGVVDIVVSNVLALLLANKTDNTLSKILKELRERKI